MPKKLSGLEKRLRQAEARLARSKVSLEHEMKAVVEHIRANISADEKLIVELRAKIVEAAKNNKAE